MKSQKKITERLKPWSESPNEKRKKGDVKEEPEKKGPNIDRTDFPWNQSRTQQQTRQKDPPWRRGVAHTEKGKNQKKVLEVKSQADPRRLKPMSLTVVGRET